MAKKNILNLQSYPRTADYFFDDTKIIKPGPNFLSSLDWQNIIKRAYDKACEKSNPKMFNPGIKGSEEKVGLKLVHSLHEYCIDSNPAAGACHCSGIYYEDIAREQFKKSRAKKTLMNSGWFFQFIGQHAAEKTGAFSQVTNNKSDIILMTRGSVLEIFIETKSRKNTIGGGTWDGVIKKVEKESYNINRCCPCLCVIGITSSDGIRHFSRDKDKRTRSYNTEVWPANFLWPFLTGEDYERVMEHVIDFYYTVDPFPDITPLIIETFKKECDRLQLLDPVGNFYEDRKLLPFFCRKLK